MGITRIGAGLTSPEGARERGAFPRTLGDPWYWLMYGGIFIGIAALIHAHLHGVFIQPLTKAAESHHWAKVLIVPSGLWLMMGTLLLIFRTIAWMCYRPFSHADPETAPSLTVVIPAYNEGPMVLKSIESVVRAHYPRDRLEVYVVDDGSRDNTWDYIEQAAQLWPDVVRPVRFPKNRGKRAALSAVDSGFDRRGVPSAVREHDEDVPIADRLVLQERSNVALPPLEPEQFADSARAENVRPHQP